MVCWHWSIVPTSEALGHHMLTIIVDRLGHHIDIDVHALVRHFVLHP